MHYNFLFDALITALHNHHIETGGKALIEYVSVVRTVVCRNHKALGLLAASIQNVHLDSVMC